VRIGLLGYGTVGSAVDAMLGAHGDDITRVLGQPVEVARALVRDVSKPHAGARPGLLCDRFEEVRDSGVSAVCEVMGGVEPTLGYVLELLERGISVVSANKQLLARHGEQLFAVAQRHGAQLRFEASVCAAIPVVKVLRESMLAAGVSEVLGIVNGTTNFILSAMAGQGADYAESLARAQELGYAEADPTDDVGGGDAAAKLAILASIAFHSHVRIDDVPYEGIDRLEAIDVALAGELGYAVKLIAQTRLSDEGVTAEVGPTLVPHGHSLAGVEGSFNAVVLRGEAIREVLLQGPGAGGAETASAVVGDLLGVLGTRGSGSFQHDGYYRKIPIVPRERVVSPLYVRMLVSDRPGVLARIASAFGSHDVSIASMIQRPAGDGEATIVLLTHPAQRAAADAAVAEVGALELTRSAPRMLRVLERS